MKQLALSGYLLAIVGALAGLTPPAIAIDAAFFSKTTPTLFLPSTGGQELGITEILLPAGKWIVNYSATAVNFGSNDFVRCYVRARETGQVISVHVANVGSQQGASVASTISGVTVANLNQPTTMVLTCAHDNTGRTPYIDPGAEIVAY